MISHSTYKTNNQLNSELSFAIVDSIYIPVLSLFVRLFATLQNQFSIFYNFQGKEQVTVQTNSENEQDRGNQPLFSVQAIDSNVGNILFLGNFKIYI